MTCEESIESSEKNPKFNRGACKRGGCDGGVYPVDDVVV